MLAPANDALLLNGAHQQPHGRGGLGLALLVVVRSIRDRLGVLQFQRLADRVVHVHRRGLLVGIGDEEAEAFLRVRSFNVAEREAGRGLRPRSERLLPTRGPLRSYLAGSVLCASSTCGPVICKLLEKGIHLLLWGHGLAALAFLAPAAKCLREFRLRLLALLVVASLPAHGRNRPRRRMRTTPLSATLPQILGSWAGAGT
mmetsp:Transcript_73173/g.211850  ORF Transcript_73173/g.211850 Transcript_73173/m.211850 type:complete len:201 (+) Transcript_73173:978-1580(+)